MIQNTKFWSFCTFSIFFHQSGPKWFRMTNFDHFTLYLHLFHQVVQNDLECPMFVILHFPYLFLSKWSKMIQNAQFWSLQSFFNIFPPKWYNIIQNIQIWLFHTFSNLFPPKWSKMIWNTQFWSFHTFLHLFPPKWSKRFGMPSFDGFTLFPILSDQSVMKYPLLILLAFFQSFPTKMVEMSPGSGILQSKLTKSQISQWILNWSALNFQNRPHFSEPVKMSPRSPVLWS